VPLFLPSFEKTPLAHSSMKFCCEILETLKLSYGENPKSLSHLVLKWYWDVTDTKIYRWMDRITIANTCYSYAVPALTHKM